MGLSNHQIKDIVIRNKNKTSHRHHVFSSVVARNVLKEVRHGLLVLDSTYRLRQHDAYVDCFDLVTLHFLDFVRDSVCNDNLQNKRSQTLQTMQQGFHREPPSCMYGMKKFMNGCIHSLKWNRAEVDPVRDELYGAMTDPDRDELYGAMADPDRDEPHRAMADPDRDELHRAMTDPDRDKMHRAMADPDRDELHGAMADLST